MKRLVLLLALLSSAAQAETILMTCGPFTFRYSDGFLGLSTPTYERRSGVQWVNICVPQDRKDVRVVCTTGTKGLIGEIFEPQPNGTFTLSSTSVYDFEILEHQYNATGVSPITYRCKRLTRG
jgi:hypothetical protein